MIMVRLFFTVVLVCSFALIFNLKAQAPDFNEKLNLPSQIPLSPAAAAIGKYGEIPVSNYTGVPEISIPLFEIVEGDINLPITLSYHAGGLKVEEMASWVGLGWSLNAGGLVSRSVRGLDDMLANGFGEAAGPLAKKYYFNLMSGDERSQYLWEVLRGVVDGEADIFSFSAGTLSGKFFFNNQGKIVASPRMDVLIRKEFTPDLAWKITDGNGITYTFTSKEWVTTEPYCASSNDPGYSGNGATTVVTAWYLTKISDPFNNMVTFTYTQRDQVFRTKGTTTRNLSLGGTGTTMPSCPPDFTECYNYNSYSSPVLSTIQWSDGKLVFESSSKASRDEGVVPIKQIAQLSAIGDTVKIIKFQMGYYALTSIGDCEDSSAKRLRLDAVQEYGANGVCIPPYKFIYNSSEIPCRLSNAQDYWGYFNGQDNGTYVRYRDLIGGPWLGAIKEPNASYTKAGVLEKILYPAGGTTEFEFEGNTYGVVIPAGYDAENPVVLAAVAGENSNSQGNIFQSFSENFAIGAEHLAPSGYARVKFKLQTSSSNPAMVSNFVFRLQGPIDKQLENGEVLELLPGNYTLTASLETEFPGSPLVTVNGTAGHIRYRDQHVINQPYGGLRIVRIRNRDHNGQVTRLKRYSYINFESEFENLSSGVRLEMPEYHIQKTRWVADPACNYIEFNSVSNYPLLETNGKPIGYEYVTIYEGENGENGKTEFTYTSHNTYPDSANFSFPFPPANSRDWRRGLPLVTTTYAKNGQNFKPVLKKFSKYTFLDSDTTRKPVFSMRLGKDYDAVGLSGNKDYDLWGVVGEGYQNVSELSFLVKDSTITFGAAITNFTNEVIRYDVSRLNFQPNQYLQVGSKGEITKTEILFPADLAAVSSATTEGRGIRRLLESHVTSTPIAIHQTKLIGDGMGISVGGSMTTFREDIPRPDTIFALKGGELESTPPYYLDSDNKINRSSQYEPRVAFISYDARGRTLEQAKSLNVPESYLWINNKVAAKIENASNMHTAFTDFEGTNAANWVVSSGARNGMGAYSGSNSYNLSNGPVTTQVKAGSYLVTYWSSSGSALINGQMGSLKLSVNNWNLVEHKIEATSDITVSVAGNVVIDDLRLFPNAALMTTFTYNTKGQIEQITDPNGVATLYEYDAIGRLVSIRDNNRNILKQYRYNYKGQ